MRNLVACCALALLAFGGVQAARADDLCNGVANNLVANCGFETGDFSGWSGSALNDPNSGVATMDPFSGLLPYQGTYVAVLGTESGTGTLTQTLATTASQFYTVEFALANDAPAGGAFTNSFSAAFGSDVLLSLSDVAAQGYTLYSFVAEATGNSTVLSFSEENDAGFWDLDSVSVQPTPEPSSLMLMGTGLLGASGAVRRKLKA